MIAIQRMLKTLVLRLSQSPREMLAEIGRRLLPEGKAPQVPLIIEMIRRAPLILQIETINACDARCVFCAYPQMTRGKGVMEIPLFEKIVKEYAGMGGGAVSLTPIMGEPLLDPHLMRRFEILADYPAINRLSMTTNAIALDKYSDQDVAFLLDRLDFIQLSIGGLDAETYRSMYGVDQFAKVRLAMDRLLALNETIEHPAILIFAFRTTDWKFERRFRRALDAYRRRGVKISHQWTFSNYGGMVDSDEKLGMTVNKGPAEKARPCALASVHMAVCWDGAITACGCADAEGRGLQLGQADRDALAAVWSGEKRAALLAAFGRGPLPDLCRQCSAYHPDSVFARSMFRNVRPGSPLPEEFYHEFWGA